MSWASSGQARSRSLKVAVISICLSVLYFMTRTAVTANRMQRDEIYVSGDLLGVLETGHLTQPANYAAGNGYPTLIVSLLEVIGFGYPALELISPFLGALTMGFFTVIALSLLRDLESPAKPWVAIGFPATLFVFAGFTVRIGESSHKTFTYSLVFLSLLAAFRCYTTSDSDGRWRVLFLVFAATIGLFNYVWAVAYGMSVVLALLLSGLPRDRAAVLGAVPLLVAYILPMYLPTGGVNLQYVVNVFRRDHGGGAQVVGDVGISAWPPVTVAGVSFSSWYVYSTGVFLVALIAGIAGLHALRRFRGESPPLSRFYTGVGLWFGFLAGGMLAAGDLPTFKRILVIPASIGVLYALHTISVTEYLTPHRRQIALTLLVVVLLLGAALAVPRAVLDGDPAPYDYYAEDNEIAKFEWWLNYGPVDSCLRTHQFIDLTASNLVWGLERGGVEPVEFDPGMSTVYSSGGKAFLSCTPYRQGIGE